MEGLKIIIVEDDAFYALRLERLVDQLGYEVTVSDNSDHVIELLAKSHYHLGLLDISIAGSMNGIELSKQFQKRKIPFIFLTTFTDKETFISAQKVKPFLFLTKPVNLNTLQSAIESVFVKYPFKIKENIVHSTAQKVFIRINNKLEVVDLSTIEVIEANGNYCDISTINQQKFTVKTGLKKILQKLPQSKFVQVHRSFIVQLELIDSVFMSKNYIMLGDKKVALGETYKANLLNKFNTFV